MAWVRVVAVKMINGELIRYFGDRIYKTYGLYFECEGKKSHSLRFWCNLGGRQYSIEREGRGVYCGQKTVLSELH